ncbi:MAG: metallopeptidase TldD-related protein [Bacillota bacterium]|nr:metallopeptidase TldD-related protein [Bacillota bacterium]
MLDQKIPDTIIKVRDSAAKKGVKALFRMHREKSHLIRIGNNSVSLNTSEDLTRLDVEVIDGRREGSCTLLGDLEGPGIIENALQVAVTKAAVATPKVYEPIERVIENEIEEENQFDQAIEELDSGLKVDTYSAIMKSVGEDYNYSGSWSSGSTEIFLSGTANDKFAWRIGTDQQFNSVLKHPEEKWELADFQSGWQVGDVTAEATVEKYLDLIEVFKKPGIRVEPGRYTVLFGAQALAEILQMLIWTGLHGRHHEEKIGWMSEKKAGDKILSDKITIIDDPANLHTFSFGFDLNGLSRHTFLFIEEGVLKNLFYDLDTAGKYGKKPTPHSGSLSAVMRAGEGLTNPFEAARNMGRVLYIPALHYINIPNMSKGLFTGSSRFSAILLENGEAAGPIFSTRITDTFQNVFSNVEILSRANLSANVSNTYGRRMPEAFAVPSYMISNEVKITDSAESFQ